MPLFLFFSFGRRRGFFSNRRTEEKKSSQALSSSNFFPLSSLPPHDAPDTSAPRHGLSASGLHGHAEGRSRRHGGRRGGALPVASAGRFFFGSSVALALGAVSLFFFQRIAAPRPGSRQRRPGWREAGSHPHGRCRRGGDPREQRAEVRRRSEMDVFSFSTLLRSFFCGRRGPPSLFVGRSSPSLLPPIADVPSLLLSFLSLYPSPETIATSQRHQRLCQSGGCRGPPARAAVGQRVGELQRRRGEQQRRQRRRRGRCCRFGARQLFELFSVFLFFFII